MTVDEELDAQKERARDYGKGKRVKTGVKDWLDSVEERKIDALLREELRGLYKEAKTVPYYYYPKNNKCFGTYSGKCTGCWSKEDCVKARNTIRRIGRSYGQVV